MHDVHELGGTGGGKPLKCHGAGARLPYLRLTADFRYVRLSSDSLTRPGS